MACFLVRGSCISKLVDRITKSMIMECDTETGLYSHARL